METNVVLDVWQLCQAAALHILGMGLALLPSHLLWRLSPNNTSAGASPLAFVGFSPIK